MQTKHYIVVVLVALLFNSCAQLKELVNFSKCDFKMGTLENTLLAGINVQQITSITDLTLMQAAKVTKSVTERKLPLSFTVNVDVRNPNTQIAAMNKMEWIAFIDDVQIATGILNDRIEVAANNGVAKVPINIAIDLFEVFGKDKGSSIVNFGLNLAGAGNQPSRVSLKIKPTILIANFPVTYPDYFTVSKEFSAN